MNRIFFLVSALLFIPMSVDAQDVSLPPVLQPWVEWVKEKQPERSCSLVDQQRVCGWSGKLALDLGRTGGTFQLSVLAERRTRVALPGGDEAWPLDVSSAGRVPLTVLNEDSAPLVALDKGRYEISGRFAWSEMPRTLPLPPGIGLITLRVEGTNVALPKVNSDGDLWLQEDSGEREEAEEDRAQFSVSRKLVDGVPFHILTQVELRISGKPRELALGNILLAGSRPVSVASPLAYKLDKDWNLTLQGRPGVYQLTIDAVLPEPPAKLKTPPITLEGWPAEEYWAFQSDAAFRAADLAGAPAIDPNRSRAPEEWRALSTYVVTAKEEVTLNETRRGEPEVPPNRLDLYRRIWLDLNGGGYTVSDQISGQMNRDWRLDMQSETKLTRVTVNGTDQVITENLDTKRPGVELRTENVDVKAVSRIDIPMTSLPAVGWDHDVNSLRFELNTGPGWTLLEAVGADNDAGTWLSTWRLWDIFFVCLMAIAAGKLLGRRIGIVSFLALVLCHQQFGAPVYIWLNLLAGKALLQALPAGRFKRIVSIYYVLSFGLLLSVLIPFAIDQIRLGLYPQLTPAFRPGEIFTMILGPTIVLSAVAALIASIVFLFRRMFRYAFQLFLLSGLLFFGSVVAVGVFSGFYFGSDYRAERLRGYATDMAAVAPAPVPQKAYQEGRRMPKSRALSDVLEMQSEQYNGLSAGAGSEPPAEIEALRKQLLQVDPKAVVQTGSSTPTWGWKTWGLDWNGPVDKTRVVQLYLLSPRMNCLLSFVRVGLLTALALAFVSAIPWRRATEKLAPALIVLFFVGAFSPSAARAQEIPSNELLTELEERIYRESCTSRCTHASSVKIRVQGEELSIAASISSQGPGAWPIPGPLDQFNPTAVMLGKESISDFRRSDDGLVWVRIPSGTHELSMRGSLRGKNVVTLQFGLTPSHADVDAPGWTVDGVNPSGAPEGTIQLIRRDAASSAEPNRDNGDSEEQEIRLADWYLVTRELGIALPWTISSTATRLGDADRAQIIKLPLLKGESVTGSAVKVEGDTAIITFPRNQRAVQWSSTFPESPQLELRAIKDSPVSETWIVQCSAIWRCSFEGIAPVRSRDGGEAAGVYRPWPGEKLLLKVARPQGIAGETATIDAVSLGWRPGSGLLQASLGLTLRTSQGGWRTITLPEGAVLESVGLNGAAQTLALQGRNLSLPVNPGEQRFDINWRQVWDTSMVEKMPGLNLGIDSANVSLNVTVPERRWLLWVGGPAWGPAVLFWGELFVVILFGALLGRLNVPPLKGWQWTLLGLGMATLHPAFMLLPAACFSLLALRSRATIDERWKFNTFQIFLAVISVITLLVLFVSIYHGLIVEPDMGISGNNSTSANLNWFVDRSGAELPQPWILSVPLWVWRLLMLCWSSWLVFAILRWMKWGWSAFSTDGVWRGKIEAA